MVKKEIYIIRHGETELNRRRIIQGQGVDAPLNEVGKLQARAFYEHYRHIDFEVVLTSKLIRTHQTVRPFIDQGIPWEEWEEINEIGWGIHEGKSTTPALVEEYKYMIEEWGKGNFQVKLEEGESAAELSDRISVFIKQLRYRPEQRILVCCHGRAMRCMMCLLKGQHLREMENYQHSNTGLFQVELENGTFVFNLQNDTRHLQKFPKEI